MNTDEKETRSTEIVIVHARFVAANIQFVIATIEKRPAPHYFQENKRIRLHRLSRAISGRYYTIYPSANRS
jgi:hypothetical protein